MDVVADASRKLVGKQDDSNKATISPLKSSLQAHKPDVSSIISLVLKLIEDQNPKIKAHATKIEKHTNLVKAIPTAAPPATPPSFTPNDRAILEMQSVALMDQGALLTNMASLL